MENRAYAFAVGLFTITLGLVIVFSVWWLSGRTEKTYDVVLYTDKGVNGLNAQAAVRFRGLRAGRVTEIAFDPQAPRRILVKLRLPVDIPLTQATRASLGVQGLTGFVFVQLDDDGSNPAPLNVAPDGLARIALDTTSQSPTEAALDAIRRVQVVAERIAAIVDEPNRLRISNTLAQLDASSQHLETLLTKMPALIDHANSVIARFDNNKLDTALDNIAKGSNAFPAALADLKQTLKSIDMLATRWNVLGADLQTRVVEDGGGRIGDTLAELQRTSTELSQLISTLERNPQAIVFGRPQPVPGPGEAGYRTPEAHR